LAQLGARLIDATAKQMAEQFFTKFSDEVQKLVPPEPVPVAPPIPAAPPPPRTPPSEVKPPPSAAVVQRGAFGLPVIGWIGVAVVAGVVVLWLAGVL
jgi:hypothetical protein